MLINGHTYYFSNCKRIQIVHFPNDLVDPEENPCGCVQDKYLPFCEREVVQGFFVEFPLRKSTTNGVDEEGIIDECTGTLMLAQGIVRREDSQVQGH